MLFIALLVLSAAAARTDDTQSDQQAHAHLTRGEKLFRDGDYKNALWNFQQANTHRPTPAAVLGAAECYEQLGERAYATYYYRAYLRRAPDASDSLEVAVRIGDVLYAELQNGRGLLEVESPVAAKGSIDGRAYNAFPIAAFLPPGDHELVVEFPTGAQKRVVSLRKGRATTSLALESPPAPVLTVATLTPSATTLNPSARSTREGSSWIVIGHPGTFSSGLSAEKLREIFSGERIVSMAGQIVQIVLPAEGARAREAFVSRFLQKTEASFKASWVKLVFRGGGARAPIELPTEEDVVKAVATRPGAIGIVADSLETSGVTRVSIR